MKIALARHLLQALLVLAAIGVVSVADYDAALHERACDLRHPGGGVVTWVEGATDATVKTAGKAKDKVVGLWRRLRGAPPLEAPPASRAEADLMRTRDLELLASVRATLAGRLRALHGLFALLALGLIALFALHRARRRLSFDLAFVALLCLAVGWGAPILFLEVETGILDYSVKHFSRSLLDTVRLCFTSGEAAVGLLLVLFTFVTPAGKLLLSLERLVAAPGAERETAGKVLSFIGKWSMVDVFVAALVVFYAKAGSTSGFFVEKASFGTGFGYFLAYCLVSAAALHLDPFADDPTAATP